jgi:hypothetical protein
MRGTRAPRHRLGEGAQAEPLGLIVGAGIA